MMAREKRKMKKIENKAARLVTFSKRRRGLFKKAQEIAILCDVQVALIVFSSTGKLYDFSTTSMKEIIEMYNKNQDDESKEGISIVELQQKKVDFRREEKWKMDNNLGLLQGKDIEGSTLNELVLIEKTLEKGLCIVLERKGQKIMEQITELQKNGARLVEETEMLRQKVLEIVENKRDENLSEPVQISQDDRHVSASTTGTSVPDVTHDIEDHSDTYLTLGLPFN